jgi:hypothetical protein
MIGVFMDKNLDFAQFLISLMEFREKQILHDLSNKFNVLTLAIEDVEDLLEEEIKDPDIFKKSLADEISSMAKAKKKYLDLSSKFKRETSSLVDKVCFSEVYEIVLASCLKDLKKKKIEINPSSLSDRPVCFKESYNLIMLSILLRLVCNKAGSYGIDFSTKDKFLKNEEGFFLSEDLPLSVDFKDSYLSFIEKLWDLSSL